MNRTREEALATRNLILNRSIKIFLRKGFSNTTLDEIARESNVTRGAIYWHFEDKQDLIRFIIQEEHKIRKKRLKESFSREMPPLKKMKLVTESIVENFIENKSFQNFIELTWFKIEYSQVPLLRKTKKELTVLFINKFKALVSEAQAKGEIRKELDPGDVAVTITHLINGMYRLYFIIPGEVKSLNKAMSPFKSYFRLIES